MADYKVPQDVEADDKLIGPFSFRQFIYLIIVALAIVAAWGLAQVFIGLAIIPLPVILFFGALALPLRKDQPMEIYLAAIISFSLKPHRRIWDPEGVETLIEVTAPKVIEEVRTKDLTESEAEKRLGYLANIVDTGGWAIRGALQPNSAMISDVFYDAQNTQDMLDNTNSVAQSFDYLIQQTSERSRQETINMMKQASMQNTAPETVPTPATPATTYEQPTEAPQVQTQPIIPASVEPVVIHTTINPYIDTSHQKVIQPLSSQTLTTPPTQNQVVDKPESTSKNTISPDIIELASNSDISVETLAKEANRIKTKQSNDDGFVISLR